jgi:hypothetical protein
LTPTERLDPAGFSSRRLRRLGSDILSASDLLRLNPGPIDEPVPGVANGPAGLWWTALLLMPQPVDTFGIRARNLRDGQDSHRTTVARTSSSLARWPAIHRQAGDSRRIPLLSGVRGR